MASYKIIWKNSAVRELKTLDKQLIPKILLKAESLENNPFPQNCKKLHGVESVYRIRIGDYRVIYQVDTRKNIVTIYHVRHRKEAYRK